MEKNAKNNLNNKSIYQQIIELNTNINNKKIIYERYLNLEKMNKNDDEYLKLKKWIKWSLELPYDNMLKIKYNIHDINNLISTVKKKRFIIKIDTE